MEWSENLFNVPTFSQAHNVKKSVVLQIETKDRATGQTGTSHNSPSISFAK